MQKSLRSECISGLCRDRAIRPARSLPVVAPCTSSRIAIDAGCPDIRTSKAQAGRQDSLSSHSIEGANPMLDTDAPVDPDERPSGDWKRAASEYRKSRLSGGVR